jgi:DNA polymerase
MIYSIDFETRSLVDLPKVGLDIYANDPSTEVLCIAYGSSPNNVRVIDSVFTQNFPLLDHVRNGGKIQAWNAMFEYAIWNCVCVPKYGWPPIKLSQCIDSMAIAAANNIPQSLQEAGLFMDADFKKDAIGSRLIQKLCKPNKKGEFDNNPELFQQLFEYCKQDVKTEMAIVKLLRPLVKNEQKIWELTQRINLRGVPVDSKELQNAVNAVQSAQKLLDDQCIRLTGCKPSERAKLLVWLNSNGADLKDLTAKTVDAYLKQRINRPETIVTKALKLRQEGSQTSVAKYAKMLEIQREGKIRNTLVYHGASTGRWASRGGLNLQNIARPSQSDLEIEEAIPRVFNNGVGTMRELSSLVRSAIKAPSGKTFVDVDFSSIENRVGVWLAGQNDKLELFRQGLDEYKTFASTSLFNVPYDKVTKDQRQIAKSAVLGAMFGQGAKGLVKYSEGMGIVMDEAQAKEAVDSYRRSYNKVKSLWYECEDAVFKATETKATSFSAGKMLIQFVQDSLVMKLPSGRLICWQAPEKELCLTPWGEQKEGITVHSQNTFTRGWNRNQLIGSSIFQSAVQATARDFLANAMLRLEEAEYELVNSVHDEVLILVDEQKAESAMEDVIRIMTTPPSWAPDFPLAAEGWHSKRYRK